MSLLILELMRKNLGIIPLTQVLGVSIVQTHHWRIRPIEPVRTNFLIDGK
jgi:hypothetical protein